jgi:hypothetical protein
MDAGIVPESSLADKSLAGEKINFEQNIKILCHYKYFN